MRLRRLDLTRYGRFTDRAIDFGPKAENGPDLHIVFGLNEAGKSTALSGYLDLLYGIEERSRYNFLHEYGAMRVGGVLELDGTEHTFSRTKQRSNSLLNAAGQPVSEMTISAHLAGLSREAYQTMFSLDDDSLEAGGKAILESRGDLGKLLFTASAGLASVNDALLALEAEADSLYRKHAHSTEIARLKKRLTDLKTEKEGRDTLASEFEALEADHGDATARYEQSLAERSSLSARLEAIARQLRALPILAEIARKNTQLAEMPDVPAPPRTWTGSVAGLIETDASLRAQHAGVLVEIQRLSAKLHAAEVDEAILAISERVRALTDRRVRYASAGLDLPARRTELQILEASVSTCLAALGRSAEPDPAALLLPAAPVGALRSLLELRSGIATSLRSARDEVSAAIEGLQAARERVGEERAVPEPVQAKLVAALSIARGSGHQQEIKAAADIVDAAKAQLAACLRRLPTTFGDAGKLRVMSGLGEQQIAAWRKRAADTSQSRSMVAMRITEHRENRRVLAGRLDALRSRANVIEDEPAAAIRVARDKAWARHRDKLDAQTADDFAAAMARDDSAGADRLTNAEHLAEIRTIQLSLGEAEAQIARAVEELRQVDKDGEATIAEIHSLAHDLVGEGSLPLETLIEMIEDRAAALREGLDRLVTIETASKRADRAIEQGREAHSELIKALGSVGITAEPGDLVQTAIAAADLFLARQARSDAERAEVFRTVTMKEEELSARRRALEIAERRERDWHTEISDVLKGTWLEGRISFPSLAGVLDQLTVLADILDKRSALALRIGKMEADQQGFIAEVNATALAAGQPQDLRAPEQLAMRLAASLEAAQRKDEEKANLLGDLRRLHGARDDVNAKMTAHEREKDEVLRLFAVSSLAEVIERDELLKERNGLRVSIAELEEKLSAELSAQSAAHARSLLDGMEVESLTREKAEVEQRLFGVDEAIRGHLVRQTRAADRLDAIGGDSAVARIDVERRTVLLEIEEKATRYIELKLGVMSAELALQAYRETHRSAMMAKASEAFAHMTRGQYSGLTTQPARGGEMLIAQQRDGKSKFMEALSKGTQFQLYLALRLAGYYEFAKLRPSVPFLADDIMETFDHIRSEEVFRLFGEMAKAGQVIYLTHHQHLCDIAKQVVPGVAVHQLG